MIKLLTEEKSIHLAEFFKVFGDNSRIKIINVLFESKMCVTHIAESLDMSISAVSHQLRVLKQAKVVKYEKSGKHVIYSLNDKHIETIFNQGIDHISE